VQSIKRAIFRGKEGCFVLDRACECGFFYIYLGGDLIFYYKFRHMKKSTHANPVGQTATTVLLAVGFLGFVLLLSYLVITGTMK
jgi:hypothetical protein